MIKGIYTSATAMRQGILRQDITANNLANAGTTGFKRDHMFTEALTAAQQGTESSDPLAIQSRQYTEFAQGPFSPTGDSLDFAIQSQGFFVLSDGQQDLYTRAGHFERTSEGTLVDNMGRAVQGEGGTITLPAGLVTVASDGRISVNGAVVDRLRVVNFDDPQSLKKTTGAAFTKSGSASETPVEAPIIRQGFLEASNVDTVKEMVDMISTARNYEINSKLLMAQDDTLKHTVGELGRV
jgi:flagellar basal-body rod protein FlgF